MSRIFDRHNYSHKTIETYEIISAYYVDIFYNHLYIEAKKMKANNNVASITEGYKHTLSAFLKSLNNPKLYKKSIVGMHHYFMNIGFASISFSACIDRLTKEFIPTDYFQSLTMTKKMGIVRMVLTQAIKNFIRKIVDDHIGKIIDYHNEPDNVRILQDDLIDCFILEREGMYQRFISNQTRTNKNDNVDRMVSEKMQLEIKRLVKEKYEQQKQIITLKKLFLKKKNEENKTNELIANLQNQIKILEEKNNFYIQTQKSFESRYREKSPIRGQILSTNEIVDVNAENNINEIVDVNADVAEHQISTKPRKLKTLKIGKMRKTPVNVKSEIINDDIKSDDDIKIESNDDNQSEIINDDNQSDDDIKSDDDIIEENTESSFIEVNNNNILSIIQNDSDTLHKMNNFKMEEGTMLDEFT